MIILLIEFLWDCCCACTLCTVSYTWYTMHYSPPSRQYTTVPVVPVLYCTVLYSSTLLSRCWYFVCCVIHPVHNALLRVITTVHNSTGSTSTLLYSSTILYSPHCCRASTLCNVSYNQYTIHYYPSSRQYTTVPVLQAQCCTILYTPLPTTVLLQMLDKQFEYNIIPFVRKLLHSPLLLHCLLLCPPATASCSIFANYHHFVLLLLLLCLIPLTVLGALDQHQCSCWCSFTTFFCFDAGGILSGA